MPSTVLKGTGQLFGAMFISLGLLPGDLSHVLLTGTPWKWVYGPSASWREARGITVCPLMGGIGFDHLITVLFIFPFVISRYLETVWTSQSGLSPQPSDCRTHDHLLHLPFPCLAGTYSGFSRHCAKEIECIIFLTRTWIFRVMGHVRSTQSFIYIIRCSQDPDEFVTFC